MANLLYYFKHINQCTIFSSFQFLSVTLFNSIISCHFSKIAINLFFLLFICTGSRFDIWYVGHIRCLNSDLRVGACEWYFHAEELEQVWGQKLVDMAFRLTDYGQKLNLTREETAALRGVSLTFPG